MSMRRLLERLKQIEKFKPQELESSEELRQEIRRISRECYCSGWVTNIEFFLWDRINNIQTEKEFGVKEITSSEIAHLKLLAQSSGGWWQWSNEQKKEIFVPMEEWLENYKEFNKNKCIT